MSSYSSCKPISPERRRGAHSTLARRSAFCAVRVGTSRVTQVMSPDALSHAFSGGVVGVGEAEGALHVLCHGALTLSGGDPVDESLCSRHVGRALDDRNTESRCGSAVGGVANLGDSLSAELGCALVELDRAVLIGQADNVLTVGDGVEADGGLLNNDHVLQQGVDVVPCLIGVDAVNGEDVAEVVPCSGGAVGIGEDYLALEFGDRGGLHRTGCSGQAPSRARC